MEQCVSIPTWFASDEGRVPRQRAGPVTPMILHWILPANTLCLLIEL